MIDKDAIDGLKWFHAIDFGDFASSGRFKVGSPQNITLYGAFEFIRSFDLSSSTVLDIGTYDGIAAFGMASLGAKEVYACDTFRQKTFLLARDLLGYGNKVNYNAPMQIRDIPSTFSSNKFDLILCAGVIYHMLYPMESFVATRKVLRNGGYLVMETPYTQDCDEGALIFNGSRAVVNEPYTYFVPTRGALVGMAQLCGFQLIAERVLKSPKRITLLLKAVDRSTLIDDPNTMPMVLQMLKRDTCDDHFRFKDIESIDSEDAKIEGPSALDGFREIIAKEEVVEWPHHPPAERPILGSTRFEAESGNTIKL